MTMKNKKQSAFLVVGLVRNGAKTIGDEVRRIQAAIGEVRSLHWLLIESDSSDDTLSVLDTLSHEIDQFRYRSLGSLKETLPQRTARIAHCRNAYLDEIRSNCLYDEVDVVIAADLDGVNTHLSPEAFDSCFSRDDWALCSANQSGPYYDIWALRHPLWSPNDCWAQYQFLGQFANAEASYRHSVSSRMITIPADAPWIEVDSAFGGLTLYKKSALSESEGRYCGLDESGAEICEHVAFHAALKASGARLFINPRLINTDYSERAHNVPFFKRPTQVAKIWIRRIVLRFWGQAGVDRLQKRVG